MMRRITIDNPKFEGTPLNMVKVESTKQSLFVQVHVVADSISPFAFRFFMKCGLEGGVMCRQSFRSRPCFR